MYARVYGYIVILVHCTASLDTYVSFIHKHICIGSHPAYPAYPTAVLLVLIFGIKLGFHLSCHKIFPSLAINECK